MPVSRRLVVVASVATKLLLYVSILFAQNVFVNVCKPSLRASSLSGRLFKTGRQLGVHAVKQEGSYGVR
jgi:hypothetical protein